MVYYRYWSTWQCEWVEYTDHKWWMDNLWIGYRRQRVQQERRRWFQDLEEDVKLRQRRAPSYLERWGNLETYPTCYNMKSWKKLTKFKKQWM